MWKICKNDFDAAGGIKEMGFRIAIPGLGNGNVDYYIRALAAAGCESVYVTPENRELYNDDEFDGLLLSGGPDVNPHRFGEENTGSWRIADALDDIEFSILDDFVEDGKPVLGICRGIQVINIYFGGNIYQHLPDFERHTGDRYIQGDGSGEGHYAEVKNHGFVNHEVYADNGSWLSHLYGTRLMTNSAHHQALKETAHDLRTDARCGEDGIVEAVHHKDLPVIGTQFHPERMCLENKSGELIDGLEIFREFARMCRKRAAE